jgi:hypothetical protein
MYEVARDPDPRRNLLMVTNSSRRFILANDGQVLCLTTPEARELVEALMAETMRVNLMGEQLDNEDG